MRIAQFRNSAVILNDRTADQAPHRFAKEKIAEQFLWQPVASIHLCPTGGSEMVQRFFLRPKTPCAALHIRDWHQWIDSPVVGGKLISGVQGGIDDGRLKVQRAAFAAGIYVPWLAVVVLRESPLASVGRSRFLEDLTILVAQSIRIVRCVKPVIHAPD